MPYLGTILFIAALSLAVSRHEMWRDEIQAWLLAKEAPTPWGLFTYIKYEGHPGLWHLLLWLPAHLWDTPTMIQLVHIMIAGGSIFLLFRFAPFGWGFRVLIACGYYFAYEWAVIARNYALSALLIFLICVLYQERWRFFPYIGGAVFLLCHTNIGSIILSMVLLVMLSIDFAVAHAGKFRGADRYFRRCMLGFLLIVSGIVTGIAQVRPPDDSNFATGWRLAWNEQHFNNIMITVHNALIPIPSDKVNFWNSSRVVVNKKEGLSFFEFERKELVKTGGILLLLTLLLFLRRPWCGLQFLLMSGGLILFFYTKYSGAWRHHGMIYLALIACFWMSYAYDPWRFPWRFPEVVADFIDRHRAWFLLPLLSVQIYGAKIALQTDWEYPFSKAYEASNWLKSEFPDWEQCFFAAVNGPVASTLCGFMNVPFYYTSSDTFGGAMIWKKLEKNKKLKPYPVAVQNLMDSQKKDCILVMNRALKTNEIPKNGRFLISFSGGIVADEQYHLYLLKYVSPEK